MSVVTPTISVVVPARNAAATIAETVLALVGQTRAAMELLVVDDGSSDATAALAARHGATVLRQAPAGPAVARNAGAGAASGDVLVFTDADCVPAPDFLDKLVAPLADPGVSGVQGAYRTRQTALVARFAQLEFEDRYTYVSRFPSLDLVATYAAAFRREVFLAEGGFATDFPVADNEDTEFSYRLCRRGHVLRFAPEALVFHRHPDRLSVYLRKKARRAYWRLAACRADPQKIWQDGYTPGLLRLQTALGGLVWLGLASWPFTPAGGGLAVLASLVLGVTALPFVRFAARRDPAVGRVAAGIIWARSLAFAAGAAAAVLGRVVRKRRKAARGENL